MLETLPLPAEDTNGESSVAQNIQEIVGAVGNRPALMVALVALSKFPEGEYASLHNQNRYIRILQGVPPSDADRGEDVLNNHSHDRVLTRAGLTEPPAPKDNRKRQPRSTVRLTDKGRLGVAVAGVLLPAELSTPQEFFLQKTYGPYPSINRTNPRPPVYRRLLTGPASVAELQTHIDADVCRQGLHLLLRSLVTSGVCEPSSSDRAKFALTNSFRPHIESLLGNITLLEGEDEEAAKHRQRAFDKARTIIKSPEYVRTLISNQLKKHAKRV